ncbi:MAG: tetratricopeptide repeat protein [Elusimicrobiota bacterium]|nr:tetratricopeptide repeat protein [Elusimicrobiota bacterium]
MPEPENNLAVPRAPLALLLTTAFFVAPLLFFTGLTRNPYYLQIAILNVSILGAVALFLRASLKAGAWQLPVTPLTRPLAALALVYLASFAWSWFGHEPFFRPAMAAEGLKAGLFFLVNCAAVFYLALSVPYAGKDTGIPAGKWLAFILGWGALWFLFPFLKMPPSGDGLFDRLLDPYGALVWISGFTAAYLLIRRCRQEDILHLALSAGAIASLYGVLEYFRIELVWAKLLNPYGNRSVSTFGNPNFISTYVVIFLPLAASLLMKAETGVKRAYYGLVFLSYGGMLMASLTRSSWIGAAAAFTFLFAFSSHRRQLKVNKKFLYPFFLAALLMLSFWPSDSLKPFSSGLMDRVSEAALGIRSPAAVSLSGDNGRTYSSFHQRLLIWTSAWQLGLENPLLGKGWGQFELFYPFYQGRLMVNFPVMRGLRTHANNAHNEILEQWSQAGLVGLGAYLWFFAVLFYGFRRFYNAASPEAGYEAVPLAAGLAGALCDNLLNVSLHFAVPGMAFWWVAGALALKTCGTGTYPAWKRPRAAAAAAWVLLLCCLGAAWLWERQFMREFRYFNGFRAMRSNNFPAAVAELEGAWKANPREVNSNYEFGNAYVRAGELEKGAWAYGEALKSNSGYDEIYFNLAIILKRLGRSGEALNYLRVSSVINPLNITTWQAIAEVYLAMPDKEAVAARAAADFEEAVKIFPNDPGLWNTLGYFHTLLKNYEAARRAYGRGVKADPGNAMLVENLAGVSRQLGLKNDPDLAWLAAYGRAEKIAAGPGGIAAQEVKAAEALLAMEPANLKARLLCAKIYYKAGRLPEARAVLEGLLKETYSDNQARYGLATIYEKEGNIQLARAEWQRFLQLEPGNAAAAQRLQALAGKQ